MPRKETDSLGTIEIFDDALWGSYAERVRRTVQISNRIIPPSLIKAFARIKRAVAVVNKDQGDIDPKVADAIVAASDELYQGRLDRHIVVPPLSGGAGIALNMNINEVIANRANEILGGKRGVYDPVDPVHTVNINQTTRNIFPVAVRVAALWDLDHLANRFRLLEQALQTKAEELGDTMVRGCGGTQGESTSARDLLLTWAGTVAQNRKRIGRCKDALAVVAIGSALRETDSRMAIEFGGSVVEELSEITGLPLITDEQQLESAANQDALVEVSGVLTSCATSIVKLSGDIILMSMPSRQAFAVQAGLPDIPQPHGSRSPDSAEYALQLAIEAVAGHQVLTTALGMGSLQVYQFLPLAAWHVLDGIALMREAVRSLSERCINVMSVT